MGHLIDETFREDVCSGSTGLDENPIFGFSFGFWNSFKNVLLRTAAQVSYSEAQIIASFSVVEDLVVPSRSSVWTVCSVLSYKYIYP